MWARMDKIRIEETANDQVAGSEQSALRRGGAHVLFSTRVAHLARIQRIETCSDYLGLDFEALTTV